MWVINTIYIYIFQIGPYSVTCILCYEWSTQPTCIPNGQNNLNLYSVFPQWSTLPARIPNGRWSLGLAVRRWWSSHVCRYSHRSSILRGQWTWSGQHETHIGYWTKIKLFLLSTKIYGLRSRSIEQFLTWRRERKLQQMHHGADNSWNHLWPCWLPSKTHIVDQNCQKHQKYQQILITFLNLILKIRIVRYMY